MQFYLRIYSNFKASPSKGSSSILIESVGQPSRASSISSYNSSGILQYLDYRQGLRKQYLRHHNRKYLVQQQAPQAIHVSISTIVYFAILFASFDKNATLVIINNFIIF